jgi:hypothetical protein
MKHIQPVLKLFVIVVAVIGSLCLASAQAPTDGYQPEVCFDLAACEQECRIRYGYELFRGRYPGPGGGSYWVYTRCLQNCNRRFWKEFDRETDDMLK